MPDSAAGASASEAARSVAMPTDCSPMVTLVATAPRPCIEPSGHTSARLVVKLSKVTLQTLFCSS
jgi:hypothetical protein